MDIRQADTVTEFDISTTLPEQCHEGTWVGRVWLPAAKANNGVAGPRVIKAENGLIIDLSRHYLTMADVFADPHYLRTIHDCDGTVLCSLNDILTSTLFNQRPDHYESSEQIFLLSPNDIQATKACGVTFVRSLLERVIEEQARGDAERANAIRQQIHQEIGSDLSAVNPGTPETEALKQRLIEQGIWSQYLEVGIGPDAEVFTKAQALSSVTSGYQIGVRRASQWNNPEPEIVLAVNAEGNIIGATLGNDVNLRDYEGRSALLLGKAKDNNAASSIGPLIRLFDDTFSIEDIKRCSVTLTITGTDGFVTRGENRMAEISRSPENLVAQTLGQDHQYPDGMMLYLGTMFAPTEDRNNDGNGFTHKPGDRVEIFTPKLGTLVNWVNYCDAIPIWDYGTHKLIHFLRQCD
jgi:fumarylacetoacetate (FAA) hydrolase family protein